MTDTVRCLRSGGCCISFEVRGVPGYADGVKPAQQLCLHLTPAQRDENGIWHRATCQLYNTPDFPIECQRFDFPGPEGMCGLGIAIWRERGVDRPQILMD